MWTALGACCGIESLFVPTGSRFAPDTTGLVVTVLLDKLELNCLDLDLAAVRVNLCLNVKSRFI